MKYNRNHNLGLKNVIGVLPAKMNASSRFEI